MQRPFEVRLPSRAQRGHRALEQFHVEREADLLDLAALFLAQQLAGTADFEVVSREHESRAEVLERLDRLEALGGIAGHRVARRRDQVRVGLVVRAADPSAQLVQLREAEAVRTVDHDRVGGRDVDAAFDDRRADAGRCCGGGRNRA